MKRTFWSDEEKQLLKELYENQGLSLSELYPIFSQKYNRTLDSLEVKIGRFKLKHTKLQTSQIKSRLNSGELNAMFGSKAWSNGLTKFNSDILKNASKKISNTRIEMYRNGSLKPFSGNANPMFGREAWSKGLTKETSEKLRISGEKNSINKRKLWITFSQEKKDEIVLRLTRSSLKVKKQTKIEIKVEEFLLENNIQYERNKRMGTFFFDFYLKDHNLVIECDGDYWHANPKFYANKKLYEVQIKNIDRDIRKNKFLLENRVDFLRFWEFDIHNRFDSIKTAIYQKINFAQNN